jgi:hypothetical protein
MYKSILNAVAVVVAVMAVMFVGCGGDDNPEEKNGGSDSKLAGDWIMYSMTELGDDGNGMFEIDTSYGKVFFTFTSSGDFVSTTFTRVPDYWDFGELITDVITEQVPTKKNGFWLESVVQTGKCYKLESQKIWLTDDTLDVHDAEYNISGNKLTLTFTGEQTIILYKSNISSTKGTLGTIYSTNSALYGDWGNDNEYLYFDGHSCESDYYHVPIGDGYVIWYTTGSRLFVLEMMLDIDCGNYCDFPIARTIELDYNISTVNGVKTLTTWLVGPMGVLLPPDVWVSEDYYYSLSKAKSPNGKHAVRPFWAFRR